MDISLLKLCGYGVETEALMADEYCEEVMCAGWNPQLAMASETPVVQIDRHVTLINVLTSGDVDAFMQLMYEHQS